MYHSSEIVHTVELSKQKLISKYIISGLAAINARPTRLGCFYVTAILSCGYV